MYAAEYIDVCVALFDYYLEQKMFDRVQFILNNMDSYMNKHPDEIRLGLMVESSRYKYGKVIQNSNPNNWVLMHYSSIRHKKRQRILRHCLIVHRVYVVG